MLAFEKSKAHQGKCTPNLLPCRINHNGPVDTSKRHWDPRQASDGTMVAYFRGRQLHGKPLEVPDGYRGVVVSTTDRILPKASSQPPQPGVEEDGEIEPDTKIVEERSDFGEIVVWGHEALPDETADPFVRGMDEWVTFAEHIHSYTPILEKESEGKSDVCA